MIKEFFKNSFIYTIGTILTRGISILLIPIYTRYISPTEYGIIDIFVVLASIINLTIALEITHAIARYYQVAETDLKKAIYTSTAFWFTILVYILYFIISYILSDTFTIFILDNVEFKIIFLLASLSIATNGIFYFVQNQLKWQIQPKNSVVVSVINALVLMCVAVFLLVFMKLKVESFFIAQTIANIVASLFAIYFAKSSYMLLFDFVTFKKMIKFSAPLVLSGVAGFISVYIDRIAIKDLLGFENLGIYGVAYRFSAVTGLVMVGFQSSMTPLITKYYKEKSTPMDVSNIFNIFSLFALFVVAGSIVFSKEIFVLFTTPDYYGASSLVPLLVMVGFFSTMYIFTPGIYIAKKTKYIVYITISVAILNTVLNYTLIPIFGLIGSAYATLISSIIGFLIWAFVSYKFYAIPYSTKRLLASFFLTVVSAYIVYVTFVDIDFKSVSLKIIYMFAIFIVLSMILFSKKQIKGIFQ